jgi:hypothetical protein
MTKIVAPLLIALLLASCAASQSKKEAVAREVGVKQGRPVNAELEPTDFKIVGDEPRFNRENTQIVFYSQFNGNKPLRIFTLDIATRKLSPISINDWDAEPSWFPAGNKVIYASYGKDRQGHTFSLWTTDITSQRSSRFLNTPANDDQQYPLVSPDGKCVIWSEKHIMKSVITDRASEQLTTGKTEWDRATDWSIDGTRILFVRQPEYSQVNRSQLCEIGVDGSQFRVIFERSSKTEPGGIDDARYSRTDDSFYYSYLNKLYRIDKGGKNERIVFELAELDTYLNAFDLSNDGQFILYAGSHEQSEGEICLRRLN